MKITAGQTVGNIAASFPAIVGIFESEKIDYCCGGSQTLESACRTKMLDVSELIRTMEKTISTQKDASTDKKAEQDWTGAPLTELIQHIAGGYHVQCRADSSRLAPLFGAVVARHGGEHPELAKAQQIFSALCDGMVEHMRREETILFPYIERIEQTKGKQQARQTEALVPTDGVIRSMMENHNEAGTLLRELRETMNGYAEPSDACNSYRALLRGLQEFEHNLHLHVHLENNVLFPRACDLGDMGSCRPN